MYSNQKNFRISVVLTLVGTVAYVVYLLILSHMGKLPVEESLKIDLSPSLNWERNLETPISWWWSVLFGPAMMFVLTYCYNQHMFTGDEPNSKHPGVQDKHEARIAIFVVTAISLVLWASCSILASTFSMFVGKPIGPLSATVSFAFVALVAYIGFGFFVGFGSFLFTDFSPWWTERKLTEKYRSMYVSFVKIGFFKTLPFILGLTTAFLIRFVFDGIVKLFRAVRVGFKTQTAD